MEELTSSIPGITPQMSGFLTSDRFWAATVFVNHSTLYMYTHLQRGQTLTKYIEAKAEYEQMATTFGIRVKKFHTDNGIFSEEGFKSNVLDNKQTISYCEVEAYFQNGISEATIKQLTEKVITMLIHAKHQWPEVIQAEFNLNNLCLGKPEKLRAENISDMRNKINIRHYHTFGCPM